MTTVDPNFTETADREARRGIALLSPFRSGISLRTSLRHRGSSDKNRKSRKSGDPSHEPRTKYHETLLNRRAHRLIPSRNPTVSQPQ